MGLIRKEDCERALRRGIEFLRISQLPNGEFVTLAGPDPDLLASCDRDPCNFTTMHVANSLLASGVREGLDLAQRAGKFLFSQMLPGGLWRFWTQDHPGARGMPPDLDDTACITNLLQRMGYSLPDNRALLAANRNSENLFYTWILPRRRFLLRPQTWKALGSFMWNSRSIAIFFCSGKEPPHKNGVDAVVNANALLVCGGEHRAGSVVAWLARLIDQGRAAQSDRWYQSEFSLGYAIARAFEFERTLLSPLVPIVVQSLRNFSRSKLSSLDAAQLLCAAFGLGLSDRSLDRLIGALLAAQGNDGSWPARAHYYGGYARARAWGSAELTTAFCVEALGRYLNKPD